MKESQDITLHLFNKDIELYKFYVEIVVKVPIFVFGVTGALLSYQLNNQLHWASLLIPALLNFGFGIIYAFGIPGAKNLAQTHETRSRTLIHDNIYYDFHTLERLLWLFFPLYVLTGIGLLCIALVHN